MRWHLANILTVGRLILVPFFLVFFLLKIYWLAFILFFVASATDLIDGTIARVMKQNSQLGAFLDPLADKLLMISAFSCLASVKVAPVWFLILVIVRDVVIMGGVAVLKVLKIEVAYEPFVSSKMATLSLMLLGWLSLGFLWKKTLQFGAYPVADFISGITLISTVLLLVSMLQYIRRGIEILQDYQK